METRLLRYFVAVVDDGTVSGAAAQLHITQPALSRQLRQLENQLGLTLFFRRSGRLQLTSQGRHFYQAAQRLLQHHRETADYAAQLAHGRLTHLSLGAPTTTLTDVVAPFVATFRQQDPIPSVTEMALDVDMHRGLSAVDLMVAPMRPPAQAQHLHLVDLPVWAYVPPGHQWADRDSVTLEELTAQTLILPTLEFKARRVLETALDEARLGTPAKLQTPHSRVAQALAAAGRGTAVVTDDPRYDLHPLHIRHRDKPLQIQLYAAWRADHHAAETLAELAQRLRAFSRDRYPQQPAAEQL